MIGISLGSQNTCIGVIKNNNVDIILSETSQRGLPTLVGFSERERLYGDGANFTIKSNFANTILYPTRYLGLKYDNPNTLEEAKYSLSPILSNNEGEIVFELDYKKEKDRYTPEAIMGVFFNKLKQNWLKNGHQTRDIVVSVPDYYTAQERNSLLEAIKIADLNCTSLVNESSAITLNYGLFRRNQFDDITPRIVGFVDMGHCKTSVFFASFTKKIHKIISVTSDRFCGARDIDYILTEYFSGKFKEKYGCDPMKSTKCKLRMQETIAKCRKILTGNREVFLTIDSLMEDEDLNFNVTREEFENLALPIINKFKDILSSALIEAKLKPSDLHSVEMVGDAVRIPILQASVKEIYGLDLSKTLSPDECIARGTTLYAAMNSPFFSLKDFTLEHAISHSIIFEYPFLKDDKLETRSTTLIQRNDNFPLRKSIKFTENQIPKNQILELKFHYSKEELPFLKNSLLKNYSITLPKITEEQYTLALEFYLDLNGLFTLDKAVILETYFEDKVIVLPKINSTTTTSTEQPTEKKEEEEKKVEKIKKERKLNCTIKLDSCSYGHDDASLTSMIQREATQEHEDKNLKYVQEKRNEIETFIYMTKEKLTTDLDIYVDKEESEKLHKKLIETESWIYNNPEETYIKSIIEEHYTRITVPGNKIYKRKSDWEATASALIYFKKSLNVNIPKLEAQLALSKENKSVFNLKEIEDAQLLIKNYNDLYNQAVASYDKAVRTSECPVDAKNVQKYAKELEEKTNKIFSEADTRVRDAGKKILEELKKLEEMKKDNNKPVVSEPKINNNEVMDLD